MNAAEKTASKPAAKLPPPLRPQSQYLTIAEFCARIGISKAFYFKQRNRGEGPVEIRMGRKVVITNDALAAWEIDRTKTNEP